ncbi:putative olfactory receptor 14L1 [Manis pentadactyla]|uniref:putative olfactory receptor 14L1 n=1 Tax=Manis pentadactyla TaxID=143292 RepID=UPI00255C40C0|nr:putative olfactory receptor 14L1 [Manis pentadactyla]
MGLPKRNPLYEDTPSIPERGFGAAEFAILKVMSDDSYAAIGGPLYYEIIMNKGACGRMMSILKVEKCVQGFISLAGFGATELLILTVMSYDRNVAICRPLHYETIMNKGACGQMVVASYVSALVYGAMHASATFSTNFSFNKIHHFFCDIPQIMVISDPKTNIDEASVSLIGVIMTIMCFTSILYSYVDIFSAVLKISSKDGRSKTLSTCIPHLVVVALFTFTAALAYLKPPSSSQTILDLL